MTLTFDFLSFGLKFALPVTRVQGHVSTKLEVSTAFPDFKQIVYTGGIAAS